MLSTSCATSRAITIDKVGSRPRSPCARSIPAFATTSSTSACRRGFYGHEPPNVFATHVAKYFANSVREDGLLAMATSGVVFSPGSAGTVQEVFQDACQNHYEIIGPAAPMVFLGERFWREEMPVLPVLESIAGDREWTRLIHVTDDADEAVEWIVANGGRVTSEE